MPLGEVGQAGDITLYVSLVLGLPLLLALVLGTERLARRLFAGKGGKGGKGGKAAGGSTRR